MLFTELRFLVFFVLAFGLFWALPRNRPRKLWLLVCSYAFYAAWDWRFLSLIFASTIIDFLVGWRMAELPTSARRRPYLWASLVANLGILGFFKYFDFFVESAAALSSSLGVSFEARTLQIVLPLGISFYTFQTLSYTIDVYRGRLEHTRSPLDFALFVAFFPQLVAGPIVRAATFLPQLRRTRTLSDVAFRASLTLFLLGYIKKTCVADHIAQVIDPLFATPEIYDVASKWLGSLLYTLQIYCDFSGYTDMALGAAGLLGYRLTENFAFPYLSRSIREYWRRWHISLSTWFRDYLYIPLGGSRVSSVRVGFNLCIVFLLCGLWHGASWTFVVWGLYHGVFLALELCLPAHRLPRWLAHVYVLLVVNVGFVFFRSADLPMALDYLESLTGLGAEIPIESAALIDPSWWLLLLGFAAVHVFFSRFSPVEQVLRVPGWVFALGFGALTALVLPWVATGYQPFIYFQF